MTRDNIKVSEQTKKYLREEEWSINDAQCGECFGLSPKHGWEKYKILGRRVYGDDQIGHEKDCKFAKLLEELKFEVHYAERNRHLL